MPPREEFKDDTFNCLCSLTHTHIEKKIDEQVNLREKKRVEPRASSTQNLIKYFIYIHLEKGKVDENI